MNCIIGTTRSIHELTHGDIKMIAAMLEKDQRQLSRASFISKKAFSPINGGLLLRKGESFIAVHNGSEEVFSGEEFHCVSDVNGFKYTFVQAVPHSFLMTERVTDRHYWTGFPLVSATGGHSIFVLLSSVRRKVILLPCAEDDVYIVVDYKREVLTSPPPIVPC